jgi:hypothetical protein
MTDKQTIDAKLAAKVAAMSVEQRCDRMFEIVDSHDNSDEANLEFAKLLLGPDATIIEE